MFCYSTCFHFKPEQTYQSFSQCLHSDEAVLYKNDYSPSSLWVTEFSSGMKAGVKMTEGNILLNFTSMPAVTTTHLEWTRPGEGIIFCMCLCESHWPTSVFPITSRASGCLHFRRRNSSRVSGCSQSMRSPWKRSEHDLEALLNNCMRRRKDDKGRKQAKQQIQSNCFPAESCGFHWPYYVLYNIFKAARGEMPVDVSCGYSSFFPKLFLLNESVCVELMNFLCELWT